MATVATTYRALHQVQGALALRAPRMAAAGASDSGVLRALPNEDVHFFVKKFDNARVVREVDSAARVSCWKTIGGAFVAALLLIGLLIPSAYNLLAGYRLHQLKAEQLRLETDLATQIGRASCRERV